MGSEGIMNESYQYFTANNLEPTVSEINNLRDNIEARDISSIQRLIDALEQLISSQQV
jgi:hypothetical protein